MSKQSLNSIPVTHRDMAAQMQGATDLIESVSWEIEPVIDRNDPSTYSKSNRRNEEVVSITELIKSINQEDKLLSDTESHTLRAIRTGIQIGRHVAEDYSSRAGVPDKSGLSGLTTGQLTEINEKKQTAAAIAQFVAMNYIVTKTSTLVDGNSFVGSVNVAIDEVELQSIVPALRCATFYLGRNITKEVHKDEQRFVAVVHDFAVLLRQEILNRSGSLKHTSFFTDLVYQIENDNFTVAGFNVMALTHETVAIKEVYPDQIIGNTEAVEGALENLRKAFLYDIVEQMNPEEDIEAVQLFLGFPGNGKSETLSMIRTIARDIAMALELPHKDLVVPNMVSKMQGESTDLAKEFLRKLFDPSSINIGIGDELEVFMPDHGGEDVSEGDKKVAVEFLKGLSGVSSVNLGNFLFFGATNYPENVDKAFMSRIQVRHNISGAETVDDYIRFIVLMLRKSNQRFPEVVKLKNVDWNMDIRAPRVKNKELIRIDPTMTVAEIQSEALKRYDMDDVRYFAMFFYMMKLRQETFSLRDCANIAKSARSKLKGYKVPDEWMTDRNRFVNYGFEEKKGLINELTSEYVNNSGIDFVQLLDQKASYYATEALRMAEIKRQRDVDKRAEEMVVKHLAIEAFNTKMNIST